MPSLNRVILIGNLGRDPEIRSLASGAKVASFSIATTETWRDKNSGEKKENTQWHNITVWQGAEVIERYVSKGDAIAIEGQLETRKWTDRDGNDRWTTEVVVRGGRGGFTLIGGGQRNRGNGSAGDMRDAREDYDRDRPAAAQRQRDPNDLDDEIPF